MKSEIRSRKSEVGNQKSEIGNPMGAYTFIYNYLRNWKSEIRSQKSEVRNQKCYLHPHQALICSEEALEMTRRLGCRINFLNQNTGYNSSLTETRPAHDHHGPDKLAIWLAHGGCGQVLFLWDGPFTFSKHNIMTILISRKHIYIVYIPPSWNVSFSLNRTWLYKS